MSFIKYELIDNILVHRKPLCQRSNPKPIPPNHKTLPLRTKQPSPLPPPSNPLLSHILILIPINTRHRPRRNSPPPHRPLHPPLPLPRRRQTRHPKTLGRASPPLPTQGFVLGKQIASGGFVSHGLRAAGRRGDGGVGGVVEVRGAVYDGEGGYWGD